MDTTLIFLFQYLILKVICQEKKKYLSGLLRLFPPVTQNLSTQKEQLIPCRKTQQTKMNGDFFLSDVYQVFIMFPKITFNGTSEDWNYNYFVLPPELYESILPCCFDLCNHLGECDYSYHSKKRYYYIGISYLRCF